MSEWRREPYTISDERARFNDARVHELLETCYWIKNQSLEITSRSLDNSLSFGVFHDTDGLIGLARVVTDRATFAYLTDVVVTDAHRGKGLSKWLMEVMLAHPDLQNLRRWMLRTGDAHELYRRFGFVEAPKPQNVMERIGEGTVIW